MQVELFRTFPGRALVVTQSSVLYVGRGYTIFRSADCGVTWVMDAIVPTSQLNRLAAGVRFAARLLRREIYGLRVLSDGARLAIAPDGVYWAGTDETLMQRTFAFSSGRTLGLGTNGNQVVFGEYGSNAGRGAVSLFGSEDGGRTFTEVYRFGPGLIRHVHSVTWDPFLRRFIVMTGDYGAECGIGVLDQSLGRIDWIVRGTQRARAVSAIIDEKGITYGTDSHLEPNYIVRLEKASGRTDILQQIEGSSLFSARFGGLHAISTCVEPSSVNRSRNVALYASHDGQSWARVYGTRKDFWSKWLQFGTLILPHSGSTSPWGVFSGQAVVDCDGRSWLIRALAPTGGSHSHGGPRSQGATAPS